MADSFKSSILLGVQLQSANEIQTKLNDIIKSLNNSKIDLDINIKNSDVSKQLETLTNLANNFKSSLGGNVSLGNINEVINQATSAMSNLNGEVLKVTTTRFNNGEIGKQVAEISTGIGTVVKQVQSLQDGTLVESAKTIITNNAKIKQSIDDITNAQQKLNQLEQNGFADKNKIVDLQNMFSNSNNFSSDNELKKYLEQVKQLEAEESKLIQIQKEENDLVNQMANGRERAEQKSQQRDRTQELNQAKAVNKALEDEYKLQQQIKNSETNSLTKDINSTISQVEKLQQKFGSKLPNGFVESTTKELNSLLGKLKETDNVNFNNIRNSLNTVKSSVGQVVAETKQLNNSSWFSGIADFLSKTGLFYGMAQAVQEVVQQFKNVYEYTSFMDKAFTDMSITMELSKQQFSDMTSRIQQMGIEYGNSSKTIMDIARVYANANTDLDTIMSKLKPDLWLANVSRMNGSEVTKTIQSMTNQFKLLTKEGMNAETATTRIGNSLVTVSKNMAYDFTAGIKELTEAVKTSGSVAETSGQSMESYLAMAGAFIEQTGKSGSEFAQSYKMIASRVLQQKELGAELGISEKEMADAEKSLKQYDISIRTSGGSLRNLDDILKDVSVKFATMSDSDKQFIANKLAGVRQTSSFIAIMESMNRQQNIYNKTQTDTNSLYDAQQKYAQSLEGKIGSLKATYETFIGKMMNSDFTKGAVTGLTELIKNFGNMPTIIGVATSALLLFKGQALTTMISDLIAVTAGESAMSVATIGLSSAFNTLKVAIATNPLGLLAVGITAIIGVMDVLGNSTEKTKQKIDELSSSIKQENDTISQSEGLLNKKNELESQISKTSEGTKENTELKKQLLDVERQISDILPQSTSGFDSEGRAISENTDLIKAQIQAKRDKLAVDAQDLISNTKDVDSMLKKIELTQKQLDAVKLAQKQGQASVAIPVSLDSDATQNIGVSQKYISDVEKSLNEYKSTISSVRLAILQLKQAGKSDDEIKSMFPNVDISAIDKFTSSVKNSTDNLNDNTKAKQDNNNIGSNAGDEAKSEEDKAQAISKATEEYNKSSVEIAKAQGFIDKLNKAQAVTPTLASQIAKKYTDIGTNINGLGSTIDFLKGKIQKQQEAESNALEIMKGDDQSFYQEKIANNQAYQEQVNGFLNAFVQDSQGAYNIDLSNYHTLNEMKSGAMDTLKSAVDSFMSQFVNTSAEGYKIDYSNFSNLINAKKEIMKAMAGSMAQFWDETSQAFGEQAYGGVDLSGGASNAQYDAYTKKAQGILDLGNKIRTAESSLDKIYAGGGLNFKGFDGKGGGVSDFSGTGGSSKKGADEAKKAQEELEKSEKKMIDDITDAYNKAKNIISNDIEEIDANITTLGKADNSNFTDRIDLTTKKIAKQQEEVDRASEQLMSLETVTVTTAEAQETLENATLKASKELRDQRLEAVKLKQSLQELLQEQEKQVLEQEKNVKEIELEAKQDSDTKKLEAYSKKLEEVHNDKLDYYQEELDELDKQNDKEEKSNELQEKKNDLKQKEIDLERAKDQLTVQTYKKDANGNWGFSYTYDKSVVDEKQKAVDEAKKSLEDTRQKQKYEEEKKAIEDQKTAEENLYKKKEEYLKQYSDDLKEQQELEKERLNNYYSDMDKLAKDRLAGLEGIYGDNWDAIAKVISTKLDETQKKFEALTEIKVNFGLKGITEAEKNGNDSSNVYSYLASKKDEVNKATKVDFEDIDKYMTSIDNSAKSLSGTYDEILSKSSTLKITDDDVKDRKIQSDKVIKVDSDAQNTQLSNLEDTNRKLESEQDTHYKNELDKQNKSQTDEYNSRVQFADKFTKFEDKFLELVQMVWDFRFSNIVNITQSSMGYVMEALVQCEEAFQDFKHMMDKMGVNIGDVDISDIQAKFNAYKQEISTWTEGKKGLYDNSNNPLYNQSVYDQYKAYENASGYSINSNVLNSLSGSGAVSTVNNNKTLTNKTDVTIQKVEVQSDNAQNLISQLVTIAEQISKTN